MTMNEYINNIAIPALNEEKSEGFVHSAVCLGTQFDAHKVAKEIQARTGFKCFACGGTIYIKMI